MARPPTVVIQIDNVDGMLAIIHAAVDIVDEVFGDAAVSRRAARPEQTPVALARRVELAAAHLALLDALAYFGKKRPPPPAWAGLLDAPAGDRRASVLETMKRWGVQVPAPLDDLDARQVPSAGQWRQVRGLLLELTEIPPPEGVPDEVLARRLAGDALAMVRSLQVEIRDAIASGTCSRPGFCQGEVYVKGVEDLERRLKALKP